MSKVKIIPDLRFPEFEKNGEWVETTIEQVAKVTTGNKDTQNKVENGKYPFFVRSQTVERINSYSFDGEAILTSGDGVGVGKNFHYINGKFDFHQRVYCIYDFLNDVCGEFVFMFFSQHFNERVMKMSAKNSVDSVRMAMITEMPICLPSKNEQQKIASCLLSLDEVIAAHSQKLNLLKEHKKGMMQNLFPQEGEKVPKYRFKEFENDGEWVEKKLGQIAENLDSKRIPITSTQREKGKVPYYGASGIVDYVRDYIFDETLLCISEDGANLIDRNYPIAFTITGKTWVNNHAHVLRFENFDTQILVEKYINAINIEDFLTGMAQPKLNRGYLDIIPIPLPKNPKEQQKIASCLSSLDALITAQAEKIEQLKLHKKGLMQGLFPKINE